jgi:hypothetical protein
MPSVKRCHSIFYTEVEALSPPNWNYPHFSMAAVGPITTSENSACLEPPPGRTSANDRFKDSVQD